MKNTKRAVGLVAIAAVAGYVSNGSAQSVDSLLNKLVDKGVLTTAEAAELREETEKDFTKAYAAKTGLPAWVSAVKFSGDVRTRYERFDSDNPAAVERNRFQYRWRAGFVATTTERTEVGFRLASDGDTSGNPISSNQTFDNNARKRGVAIDMAYGRWRPIETDDWSLALTAGKMEMPLTIASAYIDRDYTPEGFAQQLKWKASDRHTFSLTGTEFVIEEDGGGNLDSWLFGAQLRLSSTWSPQFKTSFGVMALWITQTEALRPSRGQLDIGEGNTRGGGFATNAPTADFEPLIADAAATYTLDEFALYPGKFPITVGGSFLHNPGASSENNGYNVYFQFGKAGKKKTWEVAYEYRVLEADAIYEELPESDFNAFTQAPRMTGGRSGFVNGTNIRGHILRAGYSPLDSLTFNATYWITQNIIKSPAGSDSDATRLQVDATVKF
jgi:hypothetical protein